jgi:hypothetical protein
MQGDAETAYRVLNLEETGELYLRHDSYKKNPVRSSKLLPVPLFYFSSIA